MIEEGIKYVKELLKNKNCKIMYLADRWFQNYKIMKKIEEIGEEYCMRIKSNLTFYIYNYGKMAGNIKDVEAKEKEEQYFEKVNICRYDYNTKMAVSKKEGHEEAIYVLTNGKVEEGIKNYGYRFGSIEFIFKNEKTNGFNIEKTKIKNEHAFKTMFGIMSVALLWLTVIGVEYTKNIGNKKTNVKIRIYRKNGERKISLFNTGLMYFNICLNTRKVPKIKSDFILYEI